MLSPYHILYVDDEEKALHYFREIFCDEYTVHIANNALGKVVEGLARLGGVITSDEGTLGTGQQAIILRKPIRFGVVD